MKLLSFKVKGAPSWGAVTDGGIVDLGRRFGGRWPTLRAALAAGALDECRKAVSGSAIDHSLAQIEFLPLIPDAGKILCIGLNYASHVRETGRETPKHPMIFTRFPDAQVGHGQPIVRPKISSRLDYEGELAVVIGRSTRYADATNALAQVAGYTCFNDGSVRDFQRHTTQFTAGKNFPRSGAFGPWLVTSDEIADPGQLELETRLNGEVVQQAPTSDLIFSVGTLIAYCSQFTELAPGDVIVTGTPSGVGVVREPPVFLRPGDLIEVTISGIGTLSNTVIDE